MELFEHLNTFNMEKHISSEHPIHVYYFKGLPNQGFNKINAYSWIIPTIS